MRLTAVEEVGIELPLLAVLDVLGAAEARISDEIVRQLDGVGPALLHHGDEVSGITSLVAESDHHDLLVAAIHGGREF